MKNCARINKKIKFNLNIKLDKIINSKISHKNYYYCRNHNFNTNDQLLILSETSSFVKIDTFTTNNQVSKSPNNTSERNIPFTKISTDTFKIRNKIQYLFRKNNNKLFNKKYFHDIVYCKEPFSSIKNRIDLNRLVILSDFDYTITKKFDREGKMNLTSVSILQKSSIISESFK